MASKNSQEERSFGKLVTWTIALALVFSAGLITGQRLLRRAAMPPMVSLSSTTTGEEPAARTEATPTATDSLRTTFSFYDHLTAAPATKHAEKPESAKPAKAVEDEGSKSEATEEQPAEEQPAEEKPAEEQPAEEQPAEEKPAESESDEAAAEEATPDKKAAAAKQESRNEVLDTIARAFGDDDEPAADDSAATDDEKTAALPARYTLQVSSHPDRDSAEREMDRLRKLGVEPHVVVVEVPGKGKLWRIRVGKFHSMDEARNFQRSLKAKRGVPGFVTPL